MKGREGLCALPCVWTRSSLNPTATAEHDPTPPARDRGLWRCGPPQVVGIARGGLERRGYDEVGFLKRLEVIADTGLTQVCARWLLGVKGWGAEGEERVGSVWCREEPMEGGG